MKPIMEAVTEHLNAMEVHFDRDEEEDAVSFSNGGESGRWYCRIKLADTPVPYLVMESSLPGKVAADRRAACAELLTRLNWTLIHGSFVLEDGGAEIRFRNSTLVEGDRLEDKTIGSLVLGNIWVVDRHYSVINTVIYGRMSPAVALRRFEQQLKKKNAAVKRSGVKKGPHPSRFEMN